MSAFAGILNIVFSLSCSGGRLARTALLGHNFARPFGWSKSGLLCNECSKKLTPSCPIVFLLCASPELQQSLSRHLTTSSGSRRLSRRSARAEWHVDALQTDTDLENPDLLSLFVPLICNGCDGDEPYRSASSVTARGRAFPGLQVAASGSASRSAAPPCSRRTRGLQRCCGGHVTVVATIPGGHGA
jgi:hypothetical protein